MKKIILSFILAAITNFTFAQITITNSDMPSTNDTFRLSTTTDIQGGDPTLTGANYNWNYSTLTPLAQQVDTFFSVGSTPIAYQFYFNNIILYPNHKASYAVRGIDLGIPQVPITEVFNYIKNSSSAYDNVGFGSKISGVPSSTQNIPVDREYEFPMNYFNNHISNSEYGISVPGFGYYGQSMTRTDTVDGWGSVTTPYGTFNCLRVKSVLNKIDTTYIDAFSFGSTIPRPEEIEYKWLASGMGVPVLKILTNAGFVTQIEYQDSARLLVSVEEINKIKDVTVFPNPVKEALIIDFNSTVSGHLKVNLKDILGKEVAVVYENMVTSGKNKIVIDLTQYAVKQGVYFIDLSLDNKARYAEKIVVTK